MLSLQDYCLNLLEDHQILLHDVPYQLLPRSYYRRPIVIIKGSGLCMGEHCTRQCPPPDGWWPEHIRHYELSIKYNGQYKLILRGWVEHPCCIDCDDQCDFKHVHVEYFAKDQLNIILGRIEKIFLNTKVKFVKEVDPLNNKLLSTLFENEFYGALLAKLIHTSVESIPGRLL